MLVLRCTQQLLIIEPEAPGADMLQLACRWELALLGTLLLGLLWPSRTLCLLFLLLEASIDALNCLNSSCKVHVSLFQLPFLLLKGALSLLLGLVAASLPGSAVREGVESGATDAFTYSTPHLFALCAVYLLTIKQVRRIGRAPVKVE